MHLNYFHKLQWIFLYDITHLEKKKKAYLITPLIKILKKNITHENTTKIQIFVNLSEKVKQKTNILISPILR